MCKSAAQGGQRCPGGAKRLVEKATTVLTDAQAACDASDAAGREAYADNVSEDALRQARQLRRELFETRDAAVLALEQARIVYASTSVGQAEYEAEASRVAADDSLDFADACNQEMALRYILLRGRDLRDVNDQVGRACTSV